MTTDTTLTLSETELEEITGYSRPHEQLKELHDRGYHRAYRNRLGRVVLSRAHYDAVERGEKSAPKPKVRLLRAA